MKKLFKINLLLTVLVSSVASASEYNLDLSIKNGSSVEFLKFEGPGQWDSYLAMNLPFNPMADLFKQLLINQRKPLTSRGEAHITVITPIEYWNDLRPRGITMQNIHEIAETQKIQQSAFEVVCLGKGAAVVDEKSEETFFVVVSSEDLLTIRKKVQQLLIVRGGKPEEFQPEKFYPHITLGFTKRDLHESDKVIKDKNACASEIKITP